MTTAIETFGVVRADGTLELEQKLAGAPRRVKVRLEEIEAESDGDFAARFERLSAKLTEDNRFSSKFKTTLQHPAFLEIVAMGQRVVPLIFAQIEKPDCGFLWLALPQITGVNPPIPAGHKGSHEIAPGWVGWDMEGMKAAWIAWGSEQGYECEREV